MGCCRAVLGLVLYLPVFNNTADLDHFLPGAEPPSSHALSIHSRDVYIYSSDGLCNIVDRFIFLLQVGIQKNCLINV